MSKTITLPYKFIPRDYQVPLLEAMDSGILRAAAVWHRRAGKDKTCINITAKKMFERVGTYWCIYPTYEWGKKVIWDGMDYSGMPFLDHFPESLRKPGGKNEQDLKLEMKPPPSKTKGSVFRIIGSDRLEKLRGGNPIGVVFAEWPHHNPQAWDIIRPILNENGGWVIFNYTPFGANHGQTIYEKALDNPLWFSQLLTVDDTKKEDGTPIITPEMIDEERRNGMPEELIQQEYYCSFSGFMVGAYYTTLINRLRSEGRITSIAYDPQYPVDTWWDIGANDATCIWFTQQPRNSNDIHLIDCYANSAQDIAFYIKQLKERPYTYGTHTGPHDLKHRNVQSAKSTLTVAHQLGFTFRVLPRMPFQEGIQAVRSILPRCRFDAMRCKVGIDAMNNYRRRYDFTNGQYMDKPVHDWTRDYADAFRTLGMGIQDHRSVNLQRIADTDFEIFGLTKSRQADTTFNIFTR